MSSFSTTQMHEVTKIEVSEVKSAGIMTRWQDIDVTTTDGSVHKVTLFLSNKYPGFSFMRRREDDLGRRSEDVPRQLDLPFDDTLPQDIG